MKGDYKQLLVWQKGMQLARVAYEIARILPSEEKFALSDQIRRAAVSIPSNIAEGHGRQSYREFNQFLYIARGSIYELETQLLLTKTQYEIPEELLSKAFALLNEVAKMLHSLIYSIKSKQTAND